MSRDEYIEKLTALLPFTAVPFQQRFVAANETTDIHYQQRHSPYDYREIIIPEEEWINNTPQQVFNRLPDVIAPQKEEQPS
jgi:hypothetical protein